MSRLLYVDYFQNLGFKDVWGCPWFNPHNLRQFSRYAALRGCGGMMATAWHIAYRTDESLLLCFIIQSSSAYFHNPFLKPPVVEVVQYAIKGSKGISSAFERSTGIIMHNDVDLIFRAPVPEKLTPKDAALLISSCATEKVKKIPLEFDQTKNELSAEFSLAPDEKQPALFQLGYGYADSESGFFVYKNCSQGFVLCNKPPVVPKSKKGVLLQGEFDRYIPKKGRLNTWVGGECAAPIVLVCPRTPLKQQRNGGLDTAWFDKAWVHPSDYLNHAVCDGMEIEIEAKMTGDFTGDACCALLTKGSYHTGFRVLVHNKGKLLFQFAGLNNGKPLGLFSSIALQKNKWMKIKLVYRPPKEDQSGEVCIFIDGQEQGRKSVATAMQPSAAVLGIGCEFKKPTGKPRGKSRPNFPGLIRSFSLCKINQRRVMH